MIEQQLNIICFGEVLWDILPETRQVGGAPLNVAFHLQSLGCTATIISKVGDDDLGRELLEFVVERGLDVSFIQHGKTHLTGVAKANVSDSNEVTYKILQPVAWDYIETTDAMLAKNNEADAIIFGSLASRSEITFDTLKTLLLTASYKVFDVNMRSPYDSSEIINELMQVADFIKLNEVELATIAQRMGLSGGEEEQIKAICNAYNAEVICVTKGENGATLYKEGIFYHHPGFPITVTDTIGSGDAFLSALVYKLLSNHSPKDSLAYACALGSLVATKRGGTPKILNEQISEFLNDN